MTTFPGSCPWSMGFLKAGTDCFTHLLPSTGSSSSGRCSMISCSELCTRHNSRSSRLPVGAVVLRKMSEHPNARVSGGCSWGREADSPTTSACSSPKKLKRPMLGKDTQLEGPRLEDSIFLEISGHRRVRVVVAFPSALELAVPILRYPR